MHPILNIANSAALKAGKVIIQSLNRLETVQATTKGLNDFVTEIDKAAEQQIIYVIKKAYPDHQIIAEESGLHAGLDDYVWLVDPLDGTHNFMRGLPHFCISIAFLAKGKIEHGLIFDPLRQELFTATRGGGARLNERRIRVSNTVKLENALISTGFPVRSPDALTNFLPTFNHLMPQLSNVRCLGSCALDLAYVAANRLDGFFETDLKPWDLAAGALLVKEAGGLVADWQGEENYLTKGNIVAGTPKVFSALMQTVGKKLTIADN